MTTAQSFVKGSDFPAREPGKLRIYSARGCPFAHRTRLLLNHKKIPHETVNVSLKQVEKPEWFLERNPLGLVPTLEIGDKVVYESAVCNEYLDAAYPQKKLIPDDPYLKARDKMLVEVNGKAVSAYYKFTREKQQEDWEALLTKLEAVEKEASRRGNFFGGIAPSNVDFMIWPWYERLMTFTGENPEWNLPADRLPALSSWITRMVDLPAVQKAKLDSQPTADMIYDSFK